MRNLYPTSDGSPAVLDWARLSPELRGRAPADRPYVASNFVTSLDGRVTLRGHAGGIGSRDDQRVLVALRASFDALMVGAGTLRAERYGPPLSGERETLTQIRTSLGDAPDPVTVVVTQSLDLPWDAPLFTCGIGRVLVATASDDDAPATATPVQLLRFAGAVALPELLRQLRRDCSVETLLCEGGPTLLAELARAGLLDELFVTVAPKLVGRQPDGLTMLNGPLDAPIGLHLVSLVEHAGELFTRWRVGNAPS